MMKPKPWRGGRGAFNATCARLGRLSFKFSRTTIMGEIDASKLTPTRKADRGKLAAALVNLVEREGFSASAEQAPLGAPGEFWVRIKADAAYVTIDIASDAAKHGYLTPWNIDLKSKARFSRHFGSATRAKVNRFHRRKCMGHAGTFDSLCRDITASLACIREGRAFEGPQS